MDPDPVLFLDTDLDPVLFLDTDPVLFLDPDPVIFLDSDPVLFMDTDLHAKVFYFIYKLEPIEVVIILLYRMILLPNRIHATSI